MGNTGLTHRRQLLRAMTPGLCRCPWGMGLRHGQRVTAEPQQSLRKVRALRGAGLWLV